MKLFIFWQNKQEKMKKYNLIEKQIYKLRKDEIVQLIRDLQIEAFDDFPVTEEVDKGQKDAYKKIN